MIRGRTRQAVMVVVVLALVWLGWWLLRPVAGPPPTPEQHGDAPTADTEPGPTRLDALSRAILAAVSQTTRVLWLVQDVEGQPIPGVEIVLWDGQRGISDSRGELLMEAVPWGNAWGEPHVEGPWMIVEGSSEGWIEGPEQTRLLILEPACPGIVQVVDERGRPVAGADVFLHDLRGPWTRPGGEQQLPRTDGRGEIDIPYRPCGPCNFAIRHEEHGHVPWLEREVKGEETVVLELPALQEAVVAVVDEQGGVLDAELSATHTPSIQRLGVGLFRVGARRAWAAVTVTVPGYPVQQHRVLLDGGEHSLILETAREVEIEILCDERCPEDLSCDRNACQARDDEHWTCTCPMGESSLYAQARGYFEQVPEGVLIHRIDLRSSAAARGRWTGTLPCHVAAEHGPHMGTPCKVDGRFEIDELRPGPNTLTVRHGLSEVGSVGVWLEDGETVELGDIGPSDWTVDGLIAADFPLEATILFTSPTAVVELELDGSFSLHGVPAEADTIAMDLWVPAHGRFQKSFDVPVDGVLPTWLISQSEMDDTAPLDTDYRPLMEDTGGTWEDTGLGPWGDTGWGADSGWGWDSGG